MTGDAPTAAPDAQAIADDRPCLACGYNLRGLTADGRCPECGAEVAMSLTDDHLANADPAYVRKLAWGALLLVIGAALALVAIVLPPLIFALVARTGGHSRGLVRAVITSHTVLMWAAPCLPGLMAVGVWFVTTPDVVSHRTGHRLRWIARVSSLTALLMSFRRYLPISRVAPMSTMASMVVGAALQLAAVAATILATFSLLTYLSSLSRRIPAASLRRSSSRLKWTHLVVIGVFAVCGRILSAILTPHYRAPSPPGDALVAMQWGFSVAWILAHAFVAAWLWLVFRRYRRRFKRLAHVAANNARQVEAATAQAEEGAHE